MNNKEQPITKPWYKRLKFWIITLSILLVALIAIPYVRQQFLKDQEDKNIYTLTGETTAIKQQLSLLDLSAKWNTLLNCEVKNGGGFAAGELYCGIQATTDIPVTNQSQVNHYVDSYENTLESDSHITRVKGGDVTRRYPDINQVDKPSYERRGSTAWATGYRMNALSFPHECFVQYIVERKTEVQNQIYLNVDFECAMRSHWQHYMCKDLGVGNCRADGSFYPSSYY